MLYALAHILRDKLSWLWLLIEKLNSCLFYIRYGKKLKNFSFKEKPNGYEIIPMREVPTEEIVNFFCHQPEEAFKFFHPHGFDAACIKKLQKSRAFLAYVLVDKEKNEIAGYCFNRSFFHGVGKGLGTAMNRLLNEVGFGIGLSLFETVSKDNVASYRSALSASNVKVVQELPHNELYLEILPE